MGLKQVKSKTQKCDIWAYDLGDILQYDPLISIIYGKRSNGKSFAGLELILKDYLENNNRGVWVRRLMDTFKDSKVKMQFDPVIEEGILNKYNFDGVEYRKGDYYLYRYDEDLDKRIYEDNPFCYCTGVSGAESHKGGSYENVHYVVFDEFLSRNNIYLPDEPVLFANLMSTIVRYQDKARFILLANTVNKDSDYFDAFGIDVSEIPPGAIQPFYNAEGQCLCVEYVVQKEGVVNKSDKYFSFFKSGRVKMITEGTWEMADYPRKPCDFYPTDVRFTCFILWKTSFIKCEYVVKDNMQFVYFSLTDKAIDDNEEIIFSPELDARKNWMQNIFDSDLDFLKSAMRKNKMYYADDVTGEIIRNYLIYCRSYSIIKA